MEAEQTIGLDTPGMGQLMEEYQAYKRGNLHDPVPYLEGWSSHILHLLESTSGVEPELKLHVVNIFFNTPTVDEITKDAKTNIMTQISVIGGTLGLFTGFSIMSGFEILYFATKFCAGFIKFKIETYLVIPTKIAKLSLQLTLAENLTLRSFVIPRASSWFIDSTPPALPTRPPVKSCFNPCFFHVPGHFTTLAPFWLVRHRLND